MAAFDSSVAIDQSELNAAQDAIVQATAAARAEADAGTIEGVAEGSAVTTRAVGILDSPLNFGTEAQFVVTQEGDADAKSSTVGKTNAIGAITATFDNGSIYTTGGNGSHDLYSGDRLLIPDGAGGFLERFAVNVSSDQSTFQLAYDPAGERIDATDLSTDLSSMQTERVASTAFAGFTGNSLEPVNGAQPTGTGGIIDTSSATDVDIKVGTSISEMSVDAANTADAIAQNTSGDAYSTGRIQETFGLSQIGINVGLDSSPIINVDADVSANATTIGDPTATTLGAGADAVADADASRVIAINDLGDNAGDFSFGQNLNLVAKAGTAEDKITIQAKAETQTGEAIADAATISVTGIHDLQDGDTETTTNQLTIGLSGNVQTAANVALEAVALSTTGNSTANSEASEINGIHADELSAGVSLNLAGEAESSMLVSANVVDGITTDTGTADASGAIRESKGITLEQLSIGDQPADEAGLDNILGRASSEIDVSASSEGADTAGDRANAAAFLNDAAGIELGTTGDQAAFNAGGASRLNGQVDLSLSSKASSTNGDVDALSTIGDGQDGEDDQGAIGVEFNNHANIGPGGSISASTDVDLNAQSNNIGSYGDSGISPTSEADAGADFIAGINASSTNGDVNFASDANYNVTSNVTANAEARSASGHSVSAEAGATTKDSTGSGNNDAPTETMQVYGLHTDHKLNSGGTTNLQSSTQTNLKAEAQNSGVLDEDSVVTAKAILDHSAGLDSGSSTGEITIGEEATINTSSIANGNAKASSIEGKVIAESIVDRNDGANTNITQVGTDASVTANATSTQISNAATVTSDAESTSKSTYNIGFNADNVTQTGQQLQLNSTSIATNRSEAVSLDEDATAISETQETIGIDSSALLSVGTKAEIRAQTGLVNQATASTVGNGTVDGVAGSEEDSAIAKAETTTNAGFRADDAGTSVGTDGLVIATSENSNQVSATATDGEADADITIVESLGLDLGAQRLSFGQEGQVKGSSTATNRADAVTVNGDSDADIEVNMAHGLGDSEGIISIGTDGVIDADVSYSNIAVATSTDGNDEGSDGITQATVNNDSVHGIDLQNLQSGNDLGLDVDVLSQQSASSSTIGDPTFSTSTEAESLAKVAEADDISAIDTTQISVGNSTNQLTASVTLDGEAVANNKADSALASAGDQSDVTAIDSGGTSGLVVGGSAINGMAFSATSNLRSTALSVEDQSKAFVGSDLFTSQLDDNNGSSSANINTLDGTSNLPLDSTESSVTGIKATDILIGDSVLSVDSDGNRIIQTIRSDVNSVLSATSQTTGTGLGAQDSKALISQNADGLTDSSVSIGRAGNLTSISKVQGDSLSSNIGDVNSDNNAYARLQIASDGIDQIDGDSINVGTTGNVIAQGWASGGALAETINGSSEVHGDLDVYGLNLQSDSADVIIGETGNISGLAVVGSLNQSGQFSDQINLTATTTSDSSLILSDLNSAGIRGTDTGSVNDVNTAGEDQTLLRAGSLDGDITGQALGGVRATAATIGDPSHSGVGSSDDNAVIELDGTLSGLRDVDILGAFFSVDNNGDVLAPAPMIKGTAFGDYDSTSTSVKGDAIAHSDVNAYGIFDENLNGIITTSGSIKGIAQISNTVLSTTVNGNADATAITDAIGIHGYHITMNDPGIFTATADSESVATSTSVLGRASS